MDVPKVEHFADIGKMYSEIKIETIKAFVKRFKQEINLPLYVQDVFNNIVNEFVGENNA